MAVQVRKVAQDTYLLDCGLDPFFSMSNIAYFLDDDLPALIDPGSGTAAAELLDGAGQQGIDLKRLSYIVPTHIHLDHGGGAGYLALRLPGTTVVLHPKGAAHLTDTSALVRGARLIFGDDFEKSLGAVIPVPKDRVHVVRDGEIIRLGKRELKVVFSPGHAAHHIALFDSLTKGLFCGDALGFLTDSMPDVPFPVGLSPFDPRAYAQTIDKLASLHPEVIFYAHHGPRTEVAQLIGKVKEVCLAFDEIIHQGIAAGEDDRQISQRILDYSSALAQQAELPVFARVGISGYIQYYRNHPSGS
ncbi:MAG: MBL fold metallo-hydrolase [Dehalococcoidia bacterium]|nr:MBL fold metallo-hydrolase [Dehalococcoidia bacterium]